MLYGTFAMSILFFLMSIVFLVPKDKTTILISGYYFISKNQRGLYDEFKLSKDFSIIYFKYSLIFLIGALSYIFISKLCLWIAFIIWIICIKQNLLIFNFDKYKVK